MKPTYVYRFGKSTRAYQLSDGRIFTDKKEATLAEERFLLSLPNPVNVIVADCVAMTVEYALFTGRHGEQELDVIRAHYSNGEPVEETYLDSMTHDIGAAVEQTLGLR
jgi:hypothetical protein